MEAHHTCDPLSYLEVKRSKVKVTSRINAHTYAQYLPNGKAYELQTWYTDGSRKPAGATSAGTSKVKGQGRKVTLRVCQVLACRRSKVKVTRPTNAYSGSAYIFRTVRLRTSNLVYSTATFGQLLKTHLFSAYQHV